MQGFSKHKDKNPSPMIGVIFYLLVEKIAGGCLVLRAVLKRFVFSQLSPHICRYRFVLEIVFGTRFQALPEIISWLVD